MHAAMYIVTLIIILTSAHKGYVSGIYESSYLFFRNYLAFLLSFTFFLPLTALLVRIATPMAAYPFPEYARPVFFIVVFVVFIAACDILRFKHLFPSIKITVHKYADKAIGGSIGLLNGIVLCGVLLILWTLLPFVKFIPGDLGRIHTERLPVDPGALLLRTYAHGTGRMGGRKFPLEGEHSTGLETDDQPTTPQKGYLWYYKRHADLTLEEFDRITNPEETEESTIPFFSEPGIDPEETLTP